ncbi:MAG TPA: DUF4255 domain-containing protein [Azospirillaceae bacterium]|nr:DUF4255 domain-containing protein [Azospirillaceae bacterium]
MDAIRNVLEIIRDRLNQSLQNLDPRPDEWVALTNLVQHDGKTNERADNKVVMSVYNIVNETIVSTYTAAQPGPGGFAMMPPPLYVDLYLTFMANFGGGVYAEGLAAISRVVSFFQRNPWLTHENAPDLDPTVDKITLEFASLTPADVNYVMGMMGARYLPSVFYKLRLIPFSGQAMQARTYPARGIDSTGSPMEGRTS